MKFRKLRIAFSALCGLAAISFAVLWVRSYWQADTISFYETNASYVDFGAYRGLIAISCTTDPGLPQNIRQIQIDNNYHANPGGIMGFYLFLPPSKIVQLKVPAAAVVIFFAILASAPWIHWSKRFTLRTVLVAITAVAAMLGVVAWSVR